MAKKEVDSRELEDLSDKRPKKKKKKRKCLRCCMAFLIVIVVILGAGIGVGCYFGNKILQDEFGVGLGQTLNVLTNFKNYRKAERSLKNGYDEDDAEGFVDSFSSAILLKDNAVSSSQISGIIGGAIDTLLDDGKSETPAIKAQEGGETEAEKATDDFAEILDQLLALITPETIDLDRIKNYTSPEDFQLKIVDRELASFINHVIFPAIIEKINLESMLKDMPIDVSEIDLAEIASLKEITFFKENNIPRLKVAVLLQPRKITDPLIKGYANQFKEGQEGFMAGLVGFAGGAVKNIANLFFIPKKLYITLDTALAYGANSENLDIKFSLNATNQNNIKTVNTFTDGSVNDLLNDITAKDGALGGVIKTLNEAMPINIDNHTLSVDVLQIALDLIPTEGEPLKAADLLSFLSATLKFNADKAMEQKSIVDYRDLEFKQDGGKTLFDETGMPLMQGVSPRPEMTVIEENYQKAMMDAFTKYFGLKNSSTYDTVMDALMGGDINSIIDLFDAEALTDLINSDDNGRLTINNEMMAALVASMMGEITGSVEGLPADGIIPRYVLIEKTNTTPRRNILEVDIEINFKNIIVSMMTDPDDADKNAYFINLVNGLDLGSMLISIRIDITTSDILDGAQPLKTEFTVDTMTVAQTKAYFASIEKLLGLFGGENPLDLDSMLADVGDQIRDALSSFTTALPVEIAQSALIMPDVFDAIASILGIEDLDAGMAKESLRLLINGYDDVADPTFKTESTNFETGKTTYDPMVEILNKYAMTAPDFSEFLDTVKRGDAGELMGYLDLAKFKELLNDDQFGDDEKLEINALMLYNILNNMISAGDIGYGVEIEDIQLIRLYNVGAHSYAEITVIIDPVDVIGSEDTPEMNLIRGLLKENIYLTLVVDVTIEGADAPSFIRDNRYYFNGNEAVSSNAEKLLGKLVSGLSSSLDSIVNNLSNTIKNVFDDINDSGIVSATFGESEFELSGIFQTIANIAGDDVSGTDMRLVLDTIMNHDDYMTKLRTDYTQLDYKNYHYVSGNSGEFKHISEFDGAKGESVDFESVLLADFLDAYALNGSADIDDDNNDLIENLDALIDLLSQGTAISPYINQAKFVAKVNADYADANGVEIERLLLSALIESHFSKIMDSQDGEFVYADLFVDGGHELVTIALEMKLDRLGLDSSILTSLELSSSGVLVALTVDISDIPDGDLRKETAQINFIGDEDSETAFEAIRKIAESSADFEDIADNIRKIFVDLREKTEMDIKDKSGTAYIEMPNIFDLILRMEDFDGVNDGAEIHTALSGIHTLSNIDNPINSNAIDFEEYLKGKLIADADISQGIPSSITSTISDSDLGKIIAQEIENENTEFGDLVSFTILPASGGTGDQVELTFSTTLSDITNANNPLANKILPATFNVTILLDFDVAEGQVLALDSFRINDMTGAQLDTVYTLMGLDDPQKTITDKFDACKNTINNALGGIITTINNPDPVTIAAQTITLTCQSKEFVAGGYKITMIKE